MGKFNYKPEDFGNVAPEKKKREPGIHACEVYGCNRNGHILTTNWNCRYHYAKSGESLSRISMILNNHKADFDWYERVLSFCPVDFVLGEVSKRAPYGLEVGEQEKFSDYKDRMRIHIENLLKGNEVRIPHVPPMIHRKSMAAGDEDF